MGVGVEQHLVGLQRVGPNQESATAAQFCVCDLQLHPFAVDDRPVFAPVELEGFTGPERQGNKSPAANRVLLTLAVLLPRSGKRRDPAVGAPLPKAYKVSMQLLDCTLLLA